MEDGNLLCESQNCGNSAVSFGLQGDIKIRSCRDHLGSLSDKKMEIFDISGYYFMSTLQDALPFQERKTLASKGRGNVAALESHCESELAAALRAIEDSKNRVVKSIASRFEEMKVVVITTSNQVKERLSVLEADFANFLHSKEAQLSPTAQLVCLDLHFIPKLLRFGLADVCDSFSAVLSDSWTIASPDIHYTLKCLDAAQKDEAISNALTEAMKQAEKGIVSALLHAETLIGDATSFDHCKDQVIGKVLEFEKRRIQQNWKWLQSFCDWKQRCKFSDEAIAEVGQQHAHLLYRQSGDFSEAVGTLQHCFDIVNGSNPASEALVSLCIDICDVYVASAQYQQAEQLCEWILTTFSTANFPAEHYWASIFYLTYSKRRQLKHAEATAALEKWKKLGLHEDSPLAEMLRCLTHGLEAFYNEKKEEAKNWLLKARRIGISQLPTSPFTAFVLSRLALVSEGSAREQFHRQAQSIYEVVCPKSIDAARNAMNLGTLLDDMKRRSEAEACYQQAQFIYELAAPKSVDAAHNYFNMGLLFEAMNQRAQAILCFQKAAPIYAENGDEPSATQAAERITCLGQTRS